MLDKETSPANPENPKRSALETIRENLTKNERIVTHEIEFILEEMHLVDFFVGPETEEPSFEPEMLNSQMESLETGVKPTYIKPAFVYPHSGEVAFGHMEYEESIGQKRVKKITEIETEEPETIGKLGLTVGKSQTESEEDIVRRIRIFYYPDARLASFVNNMEVGREMTRFFNEKFEGGRPYAFYLSDHMYGSQIKAYQKNPEIFLRKLSKNFKILAELGERASFKE